jgi:Zinc finger, C3HC4 type (RING finger)
MLEGCRKQANAEEESLIKNEDTQDGEESSSEEIGGACAMHTDVSSSHSGGACAMSPDVPSHSYRLIRLRMENEKLKNCLICKCCSDRKVQTLNLPCRHIVFCEQCADMMDVCIACNVKILGTVRIFMC